MLKTTYIVGDQTPSSPNLREGAKKEFGEIRSKNKSMNGNVEVREWKAAHGLAVSEFEGLELEKYLYFIKNYTR
jgi:hypothetical protein